MLATTAQMLRDRGCCSRIMLYGFSAGGLAAAAAASVPELQVDALVGAWDARACSFGAGCALHTAPRCAAAHHHHHPLKCGVCTTPVLRAALAGPGLAA